MNTIEKWSKRRVGMASIGARVVGVSLVLSVFLWTYSIAQETSTIQGHIADSSGASVPKAQVKATNESTGVSRTALSADDGYYRIVDLLAGSYQVRVEVSGFKTIVKSGVQLSARAITGLNFTLEVGEVSQTVDVTSEEPQVETQIARITEVISETEIKSLPLQGRGVLNVAYMTPGITGKPVGGDSGSFVNLWCCDAMSQTGAPNISSGGRENKGNFTLDGINMRYTEGSSWGMLFTPNEDAVSEVRVSTNPDSAEYGTMSGAQVRITTKGGTNEWHGTGQFTTNEDQFNAVPFRSTREAVPNTYTRQFGGTLGGPIFKKRFFFFGAYEGLRERKATSYTTLVETEAFRDFVVGTRPNSIAANLLNNYRPFRYPTSGLADLGSPLPGVFQWSDVPDGIPDIGETVVDKPATRRGNQFNGRLDYQSPSANDRLYASYWFTRVNWRQFGIREAFDVALSGEAQYVNVVHTHAFSPNVLNEARFGHFSWRQINRYLSGALNVPGMYTDDGISVGNAGGWQTGKFSPNVTEVGDILSINRGRHAIKVGGAYRHATLLTETFLAYEIPAYYFGSVLDFADDEPYQEVRTLDVETGKTKITPLFYIHPELSFFVSNTWQIRPNLTLNYGLRYESFFNNTMGKGKSMWEPVLTSKQLNADSAAKVTNQRVDRFYNTDWNNLSPRLGLAWDPSKRGKISIRGAFALLHDEIDTNPFYDMYSNPPGLATVTAGVQEGIPIVYGLAPPGTIDFPVNPNLKVQNVNAAGGFDGVPVSLAGIVTDLKSPTVYDIFGGVQYQLSNNLMVFGNYKYRRTTNDIYAFNANRFTGDLVDGNLDRLNPNWTSLLIYTNLGKRFYHGLIFGASKRFSQGLQFSANYTYSHGRTNRNYVGNFDEAQVFTSNMTEVFQPDLDFSRDDTTHVFHLHNVWELPILRGRKGWLAGALGGWQLNTIWFLQSGDPWVPRSSGIYGFGDDFNADGQGSERPDRPVGDVPRSYSTRQWLDGTTGLKKDLFPLPPSTELRTGNLPRDFFRGPGFWRTDAAFVKTFPVPIGRAEKAQLQVRLEAFNLFNRINLYRPQTNLASSRFAIPGSAYPMRVVQLAVKFVF